MPRTAQEFEEAEYIVQRRRVKSRLLRMHFESGVGHIGGNLSCLDMLLVLYHHIMDGEDTCLLSKGHAAGALYSVLWSIDKLPEAALETFHRDNTILSGHPAPNGHIAIPFATGSLGHGLSLAAGMAKARALMGAHGTIYCVMSDGEWQEGSSWEALIFARHHALSNLVVLVDANGLQGFGSTSEVASRPTSQLIDSIRGFGLDVLEVNGHDAKTLHALLANRKTSTHPTVIICHTVKGKGVSFMENAMEWHYLPLNAAQFEQALASVEIET